MCTVTFIANNQQDFILTSSRDELPERQTLAPKIYNESGTNLVYPKDVVAGGTWIGISSKKRMVNLLNGAFEPHIRKPSYRKSRGVVVKDILLLENLLKGVREYDYEGIEPFTIILVDWENRLQLYNLVWDEQQMHFKELSLAPHIWSSSPLYSIEMKRERETWFEAFLKKSNIDSTQLIKFHKTAGNGKKEENLIMDRGFIKTVSLTQIIKKGETVKMNYENLQTGRTSCVIL